MEATVGRNVIDKITDSIGRVTDVDHDQFYRLTEVKYPEGNQVNVVYDTVGNIVERTTTAKDGVSTVTETAHYVTSACSGSGIVISCFRPQWFEDALGRRTDFLYNAAGQLTEQTDPPDANGVRRKTYITYDNSTGLSEPCRVLRRLLCVAQARRLGREATVETVAPRKEAEVGAARLMRWKSATA